MRISQTISQVLIALFAVGCATGPEAPKHVDRVEVLVYDTTQRSKSDHLDRYEESQTIERPFKEIALLTCEGACKEEVVMTEAIFYRAKNLGADAVVQLQSHSGMNREGSHRCVFRYKAIAYEAP